MAKFRLQKVLDYRQRREDELRLRLAAAGRARAQAEETLAALAAEERARRDELSQMLDGGRIDAAFVREMGLLLDVCGRAITAQREEVARRGAFENEERIRLTTAMSERKALDKLRERHVEREYKEFNRREALVMEEIATARAAALRAAGSRQ